jgi:hypothetical protein
LLLLTLTILTDGDECPSDSRNVDDCDSVHSEDLEESEIETIVLTKNIIWPGGCYPFIFLSSYQGQFRNLVLYSPHGCINLYSRKKLFYCKAGTRAFLCHRTKTFYKFSISLFCQIVCTLCFIAGDVSEPLGVLTDYLDVFNEFHEIGRRIAKNHNLF